MLQNYLTYSITMLLPEQTYRWLASIHILPSEAALLERNMVSVPPHILPQIDSGFILGDIIKNILKKSGQPTPASLQNLRMETSKSAKLNNWNFVWLSFDDLRMQFDPRIKDLILQGESALIVEILKQLCERDENKDTAGMKAIKLQKKINNEQVENPNKNPQKSSALDIKKINLQKNPDDSQSSLEFLILLLSSALNLPVEEILGLFTNQNKYLAHIIVKGVNDDYGGILLFYSLLNKHSKKLRHFCSSDPADAHSCLYAIKPGFISKEVKVSQLTLKLFSQLGNIYDWFVSENGKGATTLLLGIKRHPHLAESYWNLLLNLIQSEEIQFFTSHFKQCFRDPEEMIEVCHMLLEPIGDSYMREKLLSIGVLGEWLEIACGMFEGDLESKLLCYGFLGEVMLWIPDSIEQNEECLEVFKVGWEERKMSEFINLLNEIFFILEKLANNKSNFASRVYQLIISIFASISQQTDKKEYLVQNFALVLPNHPKMPTHFFIEVYKDKYLRSSDYIFVQTAIKQTDDIESLVRIGDVLITMFAYDAVANHYLAPLINTIANKVIKDEVGQAFVKKAVKDGLYYFGQLQSQKKIPQVAKPQPMYFNWKGNSEKLNEVQADIYLVKEKESINLIDLVDRLAAKSKELENDSLETQLREELLNANAYLRKNTFKTGNKRLSNILRKFGISKEDEYDYDEEYRNRKSIQSMENSIARKKQISHNLSQMAASRIGCPENLKKEFNDIIEKRRRQEQEKKMQQERKQREDMMKETMILKELEVLKLMKGFGKGEVQLKEEGFWSRLVKDEQKEVQLYPPSLMEVKDTEYIENLFKRYHRVMRFLFLKYTSSMYSIKSMNNFEDNQTRKETINVVEMIKFLKDYKLFFLTNSDEIRQLVREVNVKLLNRRQTQELDFHGFEHFFVQFSAVIYTKPHTISAIRKKGSEQIKKHLVHLSHAQLLEEMFHYLKMVFAQKGEKTTMFDEPEIAYFNEEEVIKEFNKRLEEDPNFILPEGYKKITEKQISFKPQYSQHITQNLPENYLDVLQVLDQILAESSLKIHLLEPISEKTVKTRVKPHAFGNIKPKISESMDGKTRILSSMAEKKSPAIPPIKMMERKVLSFGMKLGLSYVNYKDKLLGEQVAYVIDDMLTAVENGKSSIEKQKVTNEVLKRRKEMEEAERKMEKEKEKKRKQRKEELTKMRQEITEKKEKQAESTKEEKERKKQKKLSREKKRKEEQEKYKKEQQAKLEEKKKADDEIKKKELQQKKKKREQVKKNKDKFEEFNKEQIGKFQKNFEKVTEERKKVDDKAEEEEKKKGQIYKKLRSKIRSADKRIIQIKEKNNEEIQALYSSPELTALFKEFQPNLKGLFEFLIKTSFLSITERKHNNEVILERWHYFNYAFQLNPLIIGVKDVQNIFRAVTKDKQIRKQYYLGMNFEEFQQALLRVAIKHKTVFNKISEKIKDETMTEKEINSVIQKDIEEKEKNEFDEPKDYNIRNLLKEDDVRKQVMDDYGDISKVTAQTMKGLIYYLKVPKEKKAQEEKFRDVITQKLENKHHNYEKLRMKLKEEYTLSPKKKQKDGNRSVVKSEENEPESPKKEN